MHCAALCSIFNDACIKCVGLCACMFGYVQGSPSDFCFVTCVPVQIQHALRACSASQTCSNLGCGIVVVLCVKQAHPYIAHPNQPYSRSRHKSEIPLCAARRRIVDRTSGTVLCSGFRDRCNANERFDTSHYNRAVFFRKSSEDDYIGLAEFSLLLCLVSSLDHVFCSLVIVVIKSRVWFVACIFTIQMHNVIEHVSVERIACN